MNRQYEQFVLGLFAKCNEGTEGLLHAAIGVAGEGGELLDAVKKTWVYGKPFDHVNAKEEVGDLLFYLTAFCHVAGFTLEDAVNANIEKLRKRYPQGYTDAAAIARADKQPEPEDPQVRVVEAQHGVMGQFVAVLLSDGAGRQWRGKWDVSNGMLDIRNPKKLSAFGDVELVA